MRDSGVRPPAVTTAPPSVEERVETIAREMEAGSWGAGKARDLAARWGLSRSTIRDHSAEARRQLSSLSIEDGRARVEAVLSRALMQCAGKPDEASVIARLLPVMLKLYGLDRPTSGTPGQTPPTTTTPAGGKPAPPPGFEDEDE